MYMERQIPDNTVIEMREKYFYHGCPKKQLVEEYGFGITTISHALHGKGGYGTIKDTISWYAKDNRHTKRPEHPPLTLWQAHIARCDFYRENVSAQELSERYQVPLSLVYKALKGEGEFSAIKDIFKKEMATWF